MSGRPPEPGRRSAALAGSTATVTTRAVGVPVGADDVAVCTAAGLALRTVDRAKARGAPPPCPACGSVHPPPPAVPGPPPGADVWRIGLDGAADALGPVASLLDIRERDRAARIRDRLSADRYVLTHGAVRTILGGYLRIAGCTVHWSAGRHGKPEFDGPLSHWQWSLSRSAEHALLAVCLSAPVGVDIERVDERTPAVALAARFLPLDEAASVAAQKTPHAARVAYHRLLSRKEACVKASGGRLLDGLRLNVLTPGTVHGTGAMAGHRWQLRDLSAPPGFVATLAVLDDEVRGVRLFDWGGRAPGPEPGNFRPPAPSSAADQASCSLTFEFQRSLAEPWPRGECSR
ncbi:holo-(acyl carrier protein) synthase 2 [Streptomyces sp. S4.7]|uniref:4'-phosphopantetheinyl transferase family protein n=1 Tax=Streptomyces sp. S4.7 TaxID=2705439 RepID=UPI001397186C|nr:4'-phosphopantetheinyl transferase superfamily protein [Streptomyces sp. S4.7]QHZ00001.1 holo-(acyl carrier protein) synthase 2 [Streptomyces sp. S4.7]